MMTKLETEHIKMNIRHLVNNGTKPVDVTIINNDIQILKALIFKTALWCKYLHLYLLKHNYAALAFFFLNRVDLRGESAVFNFVA